jgi:hypothetical protein
LRGDGRGSGRRIGGGSPNGIGAIYDDACFWADRRIAEME